eukprot:scaffold275128_cov19-Prasinocladus_malaysianus.AAC.1
MASVADMVAKNLDMQMKAWEAFSIDSTSDDLQGYCEMCELKPFIDDEALDRAKQYLHMVEGSDKSYTSQPLPL